MSDRDRLIELILHTPQKQAVIQGRATGKTYRTVENIADHLIANGVIVPPYKIGARVFVIASQTSDNRNLYIFADIITCYVVCDGYTNMCFENHLAVSSHNWDKVFLSREDAERALKEMLKCEKSTHSPSVSIADSSLPSMTPREAGGRDVEGAVPYGSVGGIIQRNGISRVVVEGAISDDGESEVEMLANINDRS